METAVGIPVQLHPGPVELLGQEGAGGFVEGVRVVRLAEATVLRLEGREGHPSCQVIREGGWTDLPEVLPEAVDEAVEEEEGGLGGGPVQVAHDAPYPVVDHPMHHLQAVVPVAGRQLCVALPAIFPFEQGRTAK